MTVLSTRRVPGMGPKGATIAFVGEAPGHEEESTGRPFVGSSGKLLNSILAQVGINRHECYITNVVKVRPPSNDFGVFYEDPKKTSPSQLLRDSITELFAELRDIRPTIIVPLGGEALRAITGKTSITKWRGSILSTSLGKVVPTYHPAYILRSYSDLPIFEHDLRRVQEESLFPEVRPLGHVFQLNPSASDVLVYLDSLLASPRPIAFDIETTKNHVRCLGIADSRTRAICIPFISFSRSLPHATTLFVGPTSSPEPNSHYTEEEEYAILQRLDQVFSSPAITKYAQNFPFDSQVLGREFGFKIRALDVDTMVAAHTMYCELPKGLDFLASLYTKIPYYSDYDPSVDLEVWRYNCYDCCATYEIAEVLKTDLVSRVAGANGFSSRTFLENHIQPAMTVMTRIGRRGILIDTAIRDSLKTKYSSEMEVLLNEFRALSDSPTINPGSTKQLQELFYTRLRLPPQFNPKTKSLTTDESAVEALAKKAPHHKRLFECLLEWKERQKLVSTYLDIPLTAEGRLVTSFNVVGTVTGRCNSSATLWGEGTNLQNIPVRSELGKPLRTMFIADPGYTLIKVDLSQAEFRLVVWFAGIRRIIDRYLHDPNFDVHRWFASVINNCPESEVTKAQRDVAKNGVYGGNYRMAPPKAAKTYKIPLDQATMVLDKYRKTLPEVPQWWTSIERILNASRTTVSPFGRTRVWMNRLDDSTYRDAYSHTCQCVVADLIHRAAIVSELILEECFPVLQVHDELVFLCKTNRLGDNLPKIKKIMEYPLSIPGVAEPLIIPADLSYGPSWGTTTKWKGGQV